MAVYWTRTAEVAQGKGAQAMEWAIKFAEYLNRAYPEVNLEVLTNLGASLDQVHWVGKYESLAQVEVLMSKTESDETYGGMVQEVIKEGVYRSLSDRLYRVRYPA